MSKQSVFTMKLEPELRTEFIAASESVHRPASQVVRELMREFIDRQKKARAYNDYLQEKLTAARHSISEGEGQSQEEIEAQFAAMRKKHS